MDGGFGFAGQPPATPYGQHPQPHAAFYPPPPPTQQQYQHQYQHPQPQYHYPQPQAIYPAHPAPPRGQALAPPTNRFLLSDKAVRSAGDRQVICTISGKVSSISRKSAIVLTRPQDNACLGSIKSHSALGLTRDLDLSLNGRKTALKKSGWSDDRCSFSSTIAPHGMLYWFKKEDDSATGALTAIALAGDELGGIEDGSGGDDLSSLSDQLGELTDSGETLELKDSKKHGNVLARVVNNVLTIQMPGINQALVDEVILSAVAMRQMLKLEAKDAKDAKLALKVVGGLS